MVKTYRKPINVFIDEIREDIKYQERLIEALLSDATSFNEQVVINYIEERSLRRTAENMKLLGYRTSKNTAFSPSDVKNIIRSSSSEDVREVLLEYANSIYSKNFKRSSFWNN